MPKGFPPNIAAVLPTDYCRISPPHTPQITAEYRHRTPQITVEYRRRTPHGLLPNISTTHSANYRRISLHSAARRVFYPNNQYNSPTAAPEVTPNTKIGPATTNIFAAIP